MRGTWGYEASAIREGRMGGRVRPVRGGELFDSPEAARAENRRLSLHLRRVLAVRDTQGGLNYPPVKRFAKEGA